MKISILNAAIAGLLLAGASAQALALELYVNTETQQIFAQPGPGRTRLGTFKQVDETAPPPVQAAEIASQKAEIEKIKDDLSLKNIELKALTEQVKDPALGKTRVDEQGVRWESADGNFTVKLNGRVQLDAQVNTDQSGVAAAKPGAFSNDLANGTSIRRARLSAEGNMFKTYGYKFEYDFTRGNGSTAGGVTDAFMTWNGYAPLTLTAGQFKEPISIEEATSDIQTSFIERNMAVNAFIDNNNVFKMGLGGKFAQPRWTAQTAIQTESMGNGAPTTDTSSTNGNGNANRNGGSGDTGWGLTGRLTGLPWFQDKSHLLHVGAAGSQRYINVNPDTLPCNPTSSNNNCFSANGNGARFGSAIDSNVDRSLLLDTGFISKANGSISTQTVTRLGGEFAAVHGPFSVQGEYLQAQVSGNGLNNNNLNGYYAFASWFLTGESRNYNEKVGIFDRIKPAANFTTLGRGLGAWEFLAGYDYLDLNSGAIHGGRASTSKFGLNWYPTSRIRVMTNFIHVLELDTLNSASAQARAFNGTHPDIFEMRTQLDF